MYVARCHVSSFNRCPCFSHPIVIITTTKNSTSLRVESEWREIGGRRTPVVSCYGHGGAGLTLAWGTAGDAVRLVCEALGV